MKLKQKDTVIILKGKDKGKKATIEKVFPSENKVLITDTNVYKKHHKPSKNNPQGGISNKAMPINASNVQLVCSECSKKTKIAYKLTDNKKIRVCKKCNKSLDK